VVARRVDLGTAVRVSLTGEPGAWRMEEGVVIEFVARDSDPTMIRVLDDPRKGLAPRYVVQCRYGIRVLRCRRGLIVVAP
jgi:hypothetical protein